MTKTDARKCGTFKEVNAAGTACIRSWRKITFWVFLLGIFVIMILIYIGIVPITPL